MRRCLLRTVVEGPLPPSFGGPEASLRARGGHRRSVGWSFGRSELPSGSAQDRLEGLGKVYPSRAAEAHMSILYIPCMIMHACIYLIMLYYIV